MDDYKPIGGTMELKPIKGTVHAANLTCAPAQLGVGMVAPTLPTESKSPTQHIPVANKNP